MFEGNPKLENMDDASKMVMEFAFASAVAETQLKACTAALGSRQFNIVIEEASKAINLIEKSPNIAEMMAGSMVMLYAMRAPSYQALGASRQDPSMLHLALDDYNRVEKTANMLSEDQRAMIIERGILSSARNDKARIRSLLALLEDHSYQSLTPTKKKPWWKFW